MVWWVLLFLLVVLDFGTFPEPWSWDFPWWAYGAFALALFLKGFCGLVEIATKRVEAENKRKGKGNVPDGLPEGVDDAL